MRSKLQNRCLTAVTGSKQCDATDCGSTVGAHDGGDGESGNGERRENSSPEENRLAEGDKENSATGEDNALVGGTDCRTPDDKYNDLLKDRGWGWFVVLGSFISHAISGGFDRSDGVLFLEFTERFHVSAQLTAWPGALCTALRFLSGPLATAVSTRFSVRTSVMVGTFICALGVGLSGLAPSVPYLFVTYGVLQGFGRGLVYAPAIVIVGMYFNRHRALGIGLGSAGVGAGTFLFPPMVGMLFEEFGFRGAFLILAGIVLHFCIVAALFRPLSVHRNIVLRERVETVSADKKNLDVENISITTDNRSAHDGLGPKEKRSSSITIELATVTPNPPLVGEHTPADDFQEKPASHRKHRVLTSCRCMLTTCFPVEEEKQDPKKKKLIEWSLLQNPPFLLYCLSTFLFAAAFKSAFTFLPALASSSGMSKLEGAYLLSVSGIVDTAGRILFGFILDLNCIRPFRPQVYNGVIFVIVILSFLSPYVTTFGEFAVIFGLYGMMTGTYIAQRSVVVVDFLGQDKLSSAFGLLICFHGLGTAAGPPLSGLLRDVYGTYREAYFMGGGAMALAGSLMVISNAYHITMTQRQSKKAANVNNGNAGP